jgi:hypothetical protein
VSPDLSELRDLLCERRQVELRAERSEVVRHT